MTKAEQFAALAMRCEKATGPDRELDLSIYLACYPESEIARWVRNHRRGFDGKPGHAWELRETNLLFEGHNERGDCYHNGGIPLPQYTASLDAALTLMPEGYASAVGTMAFKDASKLPWATYWTPQGWPHSTEAVTSALALCAAALRAQAQMERGK